MNLIMNVLTQKKMMILSSSMVMVFFLARILTIALHTLESYPVPASFHQAVHVLAHKHHVAVKKSEPIIEKHAAVSIDQNELHLNSNVYEFNVVFAGQVSCGTQACPATLDLTVDSDRTPEVHRVIPTMEDGNFLIQIPVSERMHEQIDWKIIAKNADGLTSDASGHRLLENSIISVDVPLALH